MDITGKIDKFMKEKELERGRKILEAKMGKLPEKIERQAYLDEYPETLIWQLRSPETEDDRRNYSILGDIAVSEAKKLKQKKLITFDNLDPRSMGGLSLTKVSGSSTMPVYYEATLSLKSFDPDKLPKELKRMGFKLRKGSY